MIRYVVDMGEKGEKLGKYSRNSDKMGEIIENSKKDPTRREQAGRNKKKFQNNPQGESKLGKTPSLLFLTTQTKEQT